MTTLLDRIHAEIRERMERHRAAVEEYRRLEAALAVLDSAPPRPAAEPARPALVEAPAAAEPSTNGAAPDNPSLDEPSALAA